MEALDPSLGAALVLAGLAAVMAAGAALWRAAGQVRVEEGELALTRERSERTAQRLQQHAQAQAQRMDVLRTLLPAAAALVGHWLGSRTSAAEEPERSSSRRCGCPPMREPPSFGHLGPDLGPLFDLPDPPTTDDETQVELDLPSLLAAAREAGLDDWVVSILRKAKGSPTGSVPHPEPEAASAAG